MDQDLPIRIVVNGFELVRNSLEVAQKAVSDPDVAKLLDYSLYALAALEAEVRGRLGGQPP